MILRNVYCYCGFAYVASSLCYVYISYVLEINDEECSVQGSIEEKAAVVTTAAMRQDALTAVAS